MLSGVLFTGCDWVSQSNGRLCITEKVRGNLGQMMERKHKDRQGLTQDQIIIGQLLPKASYLFPRSGHTAVFPSTL